MPPPVEELVVVLLLPPPEELLVVTLDEVVAALPPPVPEVDVLVAPPGAVPSELSVQLARSETPKSVPHGR